MSDWIVVNVIVALAALLQAITGSGFAIMATPFLLLVMESRECIQISIFLSFLIALVMTPKISQDINWLLLKRLIIGGFLGVPAGLWIFIHLPVGTVKLVVAIVILVVSAFTLWRWRQPVVSQEGGLITRYSGWIEMTTGFASGVLTASIGMPGVPLAMYFTQGHISKEQIRSTTLGFFIVVYISSVVLQTMTGQIDGKTMFSVLTLVPATLSGMVIGTRLFGKVNQKRFQILINGILLYTGIHMISSVL
jgi:uncharacterized membrane protein YfcA